MAGIGLPGDEISTSVDTSAFSGALNGSGGPQRPPA
jgi:hypothetical protein